MFWTTLYPSAEFQFHYVPLYHPDTILSSDMKKILMCGWRKGVFWALPTQCNPVLCLSLFLSSPIPRSYSQLLPHMPTALKMERQGYWQVRCVAPQSLSPTPSSCFSLSLCSINTQHSDLRSSAARGTLRWASRFQPTLSLLTWSSAAHREKAKQADADWSAPSASSSAPSALIHTTFAPTWSCSPTSDA